jgi:APA family basic amino acid/polyamine antiporter
MAQQQLKRLLGKGFSIAVCVGLIIGLGILRTPGEIAATISDPWIYMSLWVAGGVFVLLSVSTVAELFAITPKSGGIYQLVRHSYGPYPGFLIGWVDWMSSCGSTALKSVVVIEYAALLMPELTPFITPLALVLNTLFAVLQLGGIKLGAAIQETASVIFGMIMLSIGVALYYAYFTSGTAVADSAAIAGATTANAARYGLVVAAVIYTYDGWFAATSFGGEMKEGGRATAIGSIRGVMIVIGVYLFLNIAVVLAVPLSALAGHNLALSGAIELIFGENAATLIIVAALFILMSHHNTQYMIASRTIYALSVDGLGSDHATKVSERGTPTGALLISWLAMSALILVGGFAFLLSLTTFMFLVTYLATLVGVFRLRRKEPDIERPYRAWGYPVVGVVCIVVWTVMAAFIGYMEPKSVLFAFALALISAPAYWGLKRMHHLGKAG